MNTSIPDLAPAHKRFLNGFKPIMKQRVYMHLDVILSQLGNEAVNREHIMAAVSRAHADYVRDEKATPSETLMNSITAYRDGDWINSKEWLDELRSSVAMTS